MVYVARFFKLKRMLFSVPIALVLQNVISVRMITILTEPVNYLIKLVFTKIPI